MITPAPTPLLFALIGYGLLANALAFVAFRIDKGRAQNGDWRIPEKTLLLLAAAGGWVGAKFGQHLYNHKTHKPPFGLVLNLCGLMIPVLVVLQVVPVQQIADSALSSLQKQMMSFISTSDDQTSFSASSPAVSTLSSNSAAGASVADKIGNAASASARDALSPGRKGKLPLATAKVSRPRQSTAGTTATVANGPQRFGPGSSGKGLSGNFRMVTAPPSN